MVACECCGVSDDGPLLILCESFRNYCLFAPVVSLCCEPRVRPDGAVDIWAAISEGCVFHPRQSHSLSVLRIILRFHNMRNESVIIIRATVAPIIVDCNGRSRRFHRLFLTQTSRSCHERGLVVLCTCSKKGRNIHALPTIDSFCQTCSDSTRTRTTQVPQDLTGIATGMHAGEVWR